jgi:hypothetical protein
MGIKDKDDKFASYLTNFTKNRALVIAVDTLPAANATLPVIDMSLSQSALANTIVLMPHLAGGAGTITIQLWRKCAGFILAGDKWTLVQTTAALADTVEARFSNLLAGQYQLVCSAVSGGSSWDLYEAHTEK